ncbi:MAG: sterol desaturase family protein [Sphingobacteriales bacterium]|nr:MAG: sterol desaturase family protein [Sphingobacteriales bacterium]
MNASLFLIVLLALAGHSCAFFWLWAEGKNFKTLGFKIYSETWTNAQLKREIFNSIWTPIHAIVALGFYYSRIFSGQGLVSFVYSLLLTYIWGEIFHYYSHVLFHKPKFLWIHEEHHKSKVCTPFTAISFSFSEKIVFSVGIFALPALLGLFFPVNFSGVCTWYLGYLVVNSFGHANFEIRGPAFLNKAGKKATSSIYHALHHSRYVKNYGLGTRVLDQKHGTEWTDYEAVYTQVVVEGKPLDKLTTRIKNVRK